MDCFDGIKLLPDKSVNLVMTSPPYAMQRKKQYGGITETDYPDWTLRWMNEFWDKLTDDASICINIRPHIKNGEISDYVLKTRLLLRENGWKECEELIWIKDSSPPFGSIKRPRRAWESILWFSKTGNPKCDPKAAGHSSSNTLKLHDKYAMRGGQSGRGIQLEWARCPDYVVSQTGNVEKGYNHPAMYPPEVPEYIIKMMTQEGDLVVDPFMGSGTTGRVAERLHRKWIGFEIVPEYLITNI